MPDPHRVLLVLAHPAYERARVNPALVAAAESAGAVVHDLYEAYPDFLIDVEAEQARLLEHDVICLQFPFLWYSVPSLLKEWLDLVWLHGFAYGEGGTRLGGKRMLVATTTGASASAYGPGGGHRYSISEFLRPLEQTARLCGLRWQEPFVVHTSHALSEAELARCADRYGRRLAELSAGAR